MINSSLQGKWIVVTGGTRGLGKAIGMAFAHAGANVVLTYRWGSVPPEEVREEFRCAGFIEPKIVECDVSDAESIEQTIQDLARQQIQVHALISNVAFSKPIQSIDGYKLNSLHLSMKYSVFPVVEWVKMVHRHMGCYPRYVTAISSDGATLSLPGYDLVGISKAALESMCRYLAVRLKPAGVRVNVISAGYFDSASAREVFGDALMELAKAKGLLVDPADLANVCVALSSGLLDVITGQVIVADEGWSLFSPFSLVTGAGVTEGFPREKETDECCQP
ncbi:SDR family NAD(P)-dependent oxidoreductase [Candidatus Nitronereus thalassa]|uniref:SDR family oxidoreductase n=1 Tax=Candidatus Nitronereus thalassa TaxID=3020898 RepID=A0ABU3K496_9BACT|nr:SDR family oxidoreductase [Candidatus Nitronereus thalassa]MDT7041215.1 SDR family oxidoreductase [Candidatus Nitronereus thalassa]